MGKSTPSTKGSDNEQSIEEDGELSFTVEWPNEKVKGGLKHQPGLITNDIDKKQAMSKL